jgi:hypothetical protein
MVTRQECQQRANESTTKRPLFWMLASYYGDDAEIRDNEPQAHRAAFLHRTLETLFAIAVGTRELAPVLSYSSVEYNRPVQAIGLPLPLANEARSSHEACHRQFSGCRLTRTQSLMRVDTKATNWNRRLPLLGTAEGEKGLQCDSGPSGAASFDIASPVQIHRLGRVSYPLRIRSVRLVYRQESCPKGASAISRVLCRSRAEHSSSTRSTTVSTVMEGAAGQSVLTVEGTQRLANRPRG